MGAKIAIAGAGLLGRLCAWRLARAGHSVSLFDAADFTLEQQMSKQAQKPFGRYQLNAGSAAACAAGMISPMAELVDSEPLIYHLGLESLALWSGWLAQLNRPVSYAQAGSLVVAHPQDQNLLAEFRARMERHQLEGASVAWLNTNELLACEPALSGFAQALFLPSEAHIDNRALLQQLLIEFEQLPVACHANTPVKIVEAELQHAQTQGSVSPMGFDWVIDTRGNGGKQALPNLRGQRGETLEVHCPQVQLQRPVRCLHPRYKLYVVPKPDDVFVIGATEIEAEDYSPVSLRSSWELTSALYALNPNFAEARITASRSHCRPAFSHHRPELYLGERLISANGLYRHGFLLAPAIVASICQHIENPSLRQSSFIQEICQYDRVLCE